MSSPLENGTLYSFDGNDTPPVKFYYFDLEWKGAGIRYALYHSKINFYDIRLDMDTFQEMKSSGKFNFGQLPALRMSNESEDLLAQSAAIMRLIARIAPPTENPLYPKDDPIEAAKIDALVDQEADLFAGLTVSIFSDRFGFGFLKDNKEAFESVRKSLNEDVLPRHLANLERTIDPSIGPWLGSRSSPTIADFTIVPRIDLILTRGLMDGISTDILKPYPKILALIDAFYELESVKEFRAKSKK